MKLGIAGSGNIVPVFLDAYREVFSSPVYALCGREKSRERLTRLQEEWEIEKIFTDYEEMLSDPALSAVYVALPNTLHYEYAKRALKAGKHVLLEKPFTVTMEEAEELFSLTEARSLVLYENVSTTANPNMEKVREWLKEIGAVRLVTANYSQYSSRYDSFLKGDTPPAFDPLMKGGALRDLGVYPLQLIEALFGKPEEVSIEAHFQRGVDTTAALLLRYDSFMAAAFASKETDGRNGFTIQGERGMIFSDSAPNALTEVCLRLHGETQKADRRRFQNRLAACILQFQKAVDQEEQLLACFKENTLNVLDTVLKAERILKEKA